MQTNTPSGVATLGWFWAGAALTGLSWSFGGALSGAISSSPGNEAAGTLLLGLEVLALVALGRGRPRRHRVALVAGAVTPVVLLGLLVIWLIYSFANYQF